MFDYSEFRCEFLSHIQIRQKSDDFRKKNWEENVLPIDVEKIIAKRLNLDIIPEHGIKKLTKTDAFFLQIFYQFF